MTLNIGEQIRKHRRALELTQEQLAERLGVSFQAVSRWENGSAYPDIELLPVLAELFETSVDKLMGLDEVEKDKRAHQAISDFLNACDESEPIEKLVEMLKGIRRDHIASKHIELLFWNRMEQYDNPEILAELRKITELRLEKYPDRKTDQGLIDRMAKYDDEEHALALIKQYSTWYDMSEYSMLYERYDYRDDYEKLEPYRQYRIFGHIVELVKWINWHDRRKPQGLEYSYALNKMLLDLLNNFCGKTPDFEHQASGGGEVDFFADQRVLLGLRLSAQVASMGDPEQAFVIMEDAVTLLEKVMKIPEGYKIEGVSQFVPDIYAIVEHVDQPRLGEFIGGPTVKLNLKNCLGFESAPFVIAPREFLRPFNMPGHWAWFDPIRNDPRFAEYAERIRALSGDE